jgi:hypothetical protein
MWSHSLSSTRRISEIWLKVREKISRIYLFIYPNFAIFWQPPAISELKKKSSKSDNFSQKKIHKNPLFESLSNFFTHQGGKTTFHKN